MKKQVKNENGELNSKKSKKTLHEVYKEIRKLRKQGLFYSEISTRTGAHIKTVSEICKKIKRPKKDSSDYRKKHQLKIKERMAKYAATHINEKRDRYLKRTYGISLDDYNKMYKEQNGKCGICGKSNLESGILGVDHNHKTGKVRLLLCSACNSILGHAKENIEILEKTIEYIKKFKGDKNIND